MDVNLDELMKRYEKLPDEEIEYLARYEANDLTFEAQSILQEEIRRRGLSAKLDNHPDIQTNEAARVEYVDLVNLEKYSDRHEAELVKGLLSAHGIDAVVHGDRFGGYEPVLAFLQGVRLLVKREDLEEAKKILAETEKPTW
jgi:aspartate/methionine/tyrosine aminotransferase